MEGDKLKKLIFIRTKLRPEELKCPREKSEMTPCVARDGDLAMTENKKCVGCGHEVEELLEKELEKTRKPQ